MKLTLWKIVASFSEIGLDGQINFLFKKLVDTDKPINHVMGNKKKWIFHSQIISVKINFKLLLDEVI